MIPPSLQLLATLLAITILPSQVSSLPQTNTSPPTTGLPSTHSESPCDHHTTTLPSTQRPDQPTLSSTVFGVLSTIIAFGSLVAAIVTVMQYRQRKRKREAARSLALAGLTAHTQAISMHGIPSGTGQDTASVSASSPSALTQSYVAAPTSPSPVTLPSELPDGDAMDVATSSAALVLPAAATSTDLDEGDVADRGPMAAEQNPTRPVSWLRYRNSGRYAGKDEVGFRGCFRTFTY